MQIHISSESDRRSYAARSIGYALDVTPRCTCVTNDPSLVRPYRCVAGHTGMFCWAWIRVNVSG